MNAEAHTDELPKCSVGECRNMVLDVHEEVYKDQFGLKARVTCMDRKKIPWSALKWLVPILIVVLGMVFGGASTLLWRANAAEDNAQNEKIIYYADEHEEFKEDIKRIDGQQREDTTKIKQMAKDIEDIKEEQKAIHDIVIRIESKLDE